MHSTRFSSPFSRHSNSNNDHLHPLLSSLPLARDQRRVQAHDLLLPLCIWPVRSSHRSTGRAQSRLPFSSLDTERGKVWLAERGELLHQAAQVSERKANELGSRKRCALSSEGSSALRENFPLKKKIMSNFFLHPHPILAIKFQHRLLLDSHTLGGGARTIATATAGSMGLLQFARLSCLSRCNMSVAIVATIFLFAHTHIQY